MTFLDGRPLEASPDSWPVRPDAWGTVTVRGRSLTVAAMPHPDRVGEPAPCLGDDRFTGEKNGPLSAAVRAELTAVCVSCPSVLRVACHWFALANDPYWFAAGLTNTERQVIRDGIGLHPVAPDDLHLYGLGTDWRPHVTPLMPYEGSNDDEDWGSEW